MIDPTHPEAYDPTWRPPRKPTPAPAIAADLARVKADVAKLGDEISGLRADLRSITETLATVVGVVEASGRLLLRGELHELRRGLASGTPFSNALVSTRVNELSFAEMLEHRAALQKYHGRGP
jgi:hypothetical protein